MMTALWHKSYSKNNSNYYYDTWLKNSGFLIECNSCTVAMQSGAYYETIIIL